MSPKFLLQLLTSLLFLALVGCESKVKFARAENSEVNPNKLAKVTELTKGILSLQREGQYYQLDEGEATVDMINGLTEEVQQSSYQQIESSFGDYQDVKFDHLMKATDGRLIELYRFRGEFSLGTEVEVRAVIDANGKLASFFVKPWNDNP